MLYKGAIETLGNAILLRRMVDSQLSLDTLARQVSIELCAQVFTSSIRAKFADLGTWVLAHKTCLVSFEGQY
jgi:hypothetical protein